MQFADFSQNVLMCLGLFICSSLEGSATERVGPCAKALILQRVLTDAASRRVPLKVGLFK